MAMTPASTVATQIVSDLAIPAAGQTLAHAEWQAIITRIQAMISAGTVSCTVVGTTTGVQSGASTAPTTGTASGTLT